MSTNYITDSDKEAPETHALRSWVNSEVDQEIKKQRVKNLPLIILMTLNFLLTIMLYISYIFG